MEGTRSRTVDDKYWQITTKDGEINPKPLSITQQDKE